MRLFSEDSGYILDPDLSSPSVESDMLHSFGTLVPQLQHRPTMMNQTMLDDVGSVWPGFYCCKKWILLTLGALKRQDYYLPVEVSLHNKKQKKLTVRVY